MMLVQKKKKRFVLTHPARCIVARRIPNRYCLSSVYAPKSSIRRSRISTKLLRSTSGSVRPPIVAISYSACNFSVLACELASDAVVAGERLLIMLTLKFARIDSKCFVSACRKPSNALPMPTLKSDEMLPVSELSNLSRTFHLPVIHAASAANGRTRAEDEGLEAAQRSAKFRRDSDCC